MAVVGWDDTIPAEELSVNGNTPSQDGAFIIKNSWGTDCGSGGYYYVPYEPYMLNGSSVFFAFADADTYTYSYGYDDTTGCKPYFDENALNSVTAANVFTAVADDETLEAVSFFTENDNIGYEVRIYTDLPQDCASPEEGTLRASAEGSVGEHGYHTMTLHEAVPLKAGERFSVVVTLSGTDSERTEFVLSAYTFDDFKRERGESFLYAASRGWYDICDSGMDFIGNARIKAFTVSPSAPALVEPEDYDSYNGTAREQLLQQSEDAQARYAVMLGKGRFNFNFEDLDRLDNYAMIFDSISEYSDMYTASEIYATTSNFVALLDNVRPLDPTSLLLNLDYIARKMMSGKYMQELESWQEYKEKYDEIAAMAKRQEITPDSLYDLRQSLGESFIKLLEENIRCGYGVSRLQDYGDVDHDGKVTVLDATRIQRILAEIDENTLFSVMNGDVDADGEMTVLDATAIQKKLASIIGHFTVYDDNCYVEDAYTADSSREELKAYLRGAIEERAAWENMQITTDHEFDQILSYVIYHHAKEVLADADHMDKAVLLFYTRNLISHVRTRTW